MLKPSLNKTIVSAAPEAASASVPEHANVRVQVTRTDNRARESGNSQGSGKLSAGAIGRLNHFCQADGELCALADVAGARRSGCCAQRATSVVCEQDVEAFRQQLPAERSIRRARSISASVTGENALGELMAERSRATSRTVTRGPQPAQASNLQLLVP
jgi:hypothetical protein